MTDKKPSPAPFSELLSLQASDLKALQLIRQEKDSALYADAAWDELVTNTDIVQALYDLEFEAPSRIQCQALPILTRDPPRSLIAQAPSGSGKTVAFATSMLIRVDPHLKALQAICLANTLELVKQTFEVCKSLNKYTKFNLGWTVGEHLEGGREVQVLIGTPAAVSSGMSEKSRFSASQVKILIIDEADELVKKPPPPRKGDRGPPKTTFHRTLDILIRKKLPPNIPIGFFSASFSPDSIASIKEWRPEAVEVRKKEVPKQIRHFYFVTSNPEQDAVIQLQRIAQERFLSQGIIFLARKDQPQGIAAALTKLGMDCRWVTGNTDRQERVKTLTEFRDNKFKFLATTNMYARGIDIQEVFLVIQFGISRRVGDALRPNVVDYQHRAGRAGRFGRSGVCISFVNGDEVPLIRLIAKDLQIKIEELTASNFEALPEDVPIATPADAPPSPPEDAPPAPPEDAAQPADPPPE
jgi:ATP-dependent RNA helicase DDX19/DBP5